MPTCSSSTAYRWVLWIEGIALVFKLQSIHLSMPLLDAGRKRTLPPLFLVQVARSLALAFGGEGNQTGGNQNAL